MSQTTDVVLAPKPLKLLSVIFLLCAASGCATSETHRGQAVLDLKPQTLTSDLYVEQSGKSYKIKADTSLIDPKSMRIDLMTTLDLPLASIVFNNEKLSYVLYRDKKYFTGRAGPHALDPLFPLSVNVETLVEIFQQRKIEGADCQTEGEALVSCSGRAGDTVYKVAWSKWQSSGPLAGRATKIVLDLPERHVSLRFYLNAWQRDVSNAERLLQLTIPNGFTPIL